MQQNVWHECHRTDGEAAPSLSSAAAEDGKMRCLSTLTMRRLSLILVCNLTHFYQRTNSNNQVLHEDQAKMSHGEK